MKPQKLTRRQAWLFIRRHFKAYIKSYRRNVYTNFGLCNAPKCLLRRKLITVRCLYAMRRNINSQEPKDSTGGYYWALGVAGARERVKAINRILKTIK